MTPCTTCKGRCPAPAACELPIQPSAEEIRRARLARWKSRLACVAFIGGAALLGAVAAFAFGRSYAG
jgi:hypothetical protein